VFKNGDTFYYSEEVVVRVLVVGSCGKRKLHNSPKQPKCQDIRARHGIGYWRKRFSKLSTPVRDMYTGPQNTELVKAVDLLRTISGVDVHFSIISAGFGFLHEHERVPPYDCSFTNMKMRDVRTRSEDLGIQSAFSSLISKDFDLVYLALGKRYLASLGRDTLSAIQIPTVVFHEYESEYLIRIPCSAQTVKAFSKQGHKIHGVVGFKGDLLRVLARFTLERPNPGSEVRKWGTMNYLRKLVHRIGSLDKLNE
jgi:hypothetical protein